MKKPDFKEKKTLEKYSSAFTLSDMEIFIFPDLFFPLVLANIMSPILWRWRDDPWFANLENKSVTFKLNRIKQYIMDNYLFNLDLETWGLTSRPKEMERFKEFVSLEDLAQSNALFGYEGDKYYFDIDIRRHFGLEKYDSDTIPYWKTETIEAMTAFRHKPGYTTGAGECVSFSSLYAAALFVVGNVPLEDIYLIATPLHSQNFIDIGEGYITNNRRVMTKTMWFNGTSISAKARRALENEKISVISHLTGHIHALYDESSISPTHFKKFSENLTKYLTTSITSEILCNFLRQDEGARGCFQYRVNRNGKELYIGLERLYAYEHTSKFTFSPGTRDKLIQEIDAEEFDCSPKVGMALLNDFEEYLSTTDIAAPIDVNDFRQKGLLPPHCPHAIEFCQKLETFRKTMPQLPNLAEKRVVSKPYPKITVDMTRDQIIAEIEATRDSAESSLLALYAYREMRFVDFHPFLLAAIERNPVSLQAMTGKTADEIFAHLNTLSNESIYPGTRLAQPDEVINYGRGDGLEKALVLANCIVNFSQEGTSLIKGFFIDSQEGQVTLSIGETKSMVFVFGTDKNIPVSFKWPYKS